MWNKDNYKSKLRTDVNKFILGLKSKNIFFTETNDENVLFKLDKKELIMSQHSFYRYSGIAYVYKEGKEKNSVLSIEVTYEMYLNMIIKPIIENHFKS